MHAYFPALNSYPSLLGDMLADAINCLGFTWVSSNTIGNQIYMLIIQINQGSLFEIIAVLWTLIIYSYLHLDEICSAYMRASLKLSTPFVLQFYLFTQRWGLKKYYVIFLHSSIHSVQWPTILRIPSKRKFLVSCKATCKPQPVRLSPWEINNPAKHCRAAQTDESRRVQDLGFRVDVPLSQN